MNPASATLPTASLDWQGPGARDRTKRVFKWSVFLWSMVFPPKRHRISPTLPGIFLFVVAMGIGSAAYNTASNILFITLALLLSCLLLSGLLSWFNFMGVCWRVQPQGPWRAGHEALVHVEVRNTKAWLPTYGLWFELATHPVKTPPPDDGEFDGKKIRQILAEAEKAVTHGRIFLRERLEPRGETAVDWVVKPSARGQAVVEMSAVGSLFPFGFLRKNIGTGLKGRVLVWPAQVEYQAHAAMAAHTGTSGTRTARAGPGEDLLSLRKYAQGDSHRLIHWKATARLGQLMVRQFAAESHDGYVLWVDAPAEVWTRPEQFELLCGLAGTMAEDLFTAGRLKGTCVNDGPLREARRVRDVEAFLDELALLQPVARASAPPFPAAGPGGRNLVSFTPEGTKGVAAHVDGVKAASA
jgi:uncharacterized protein (DUF58 family)